MKKTNVVLVIVGAAALFLASSYLFSDDETPYDGNSPPFSLKMIIESDDPFSGYLLT